MKQNVVGCNVQTLVISLHCIKAVYLHENRLTDSFLLH